MSELKATPGPWHAEENNIHTGSVATCHWNGEQWWEVWTPMWVDGGSAKANAHLIAAAPELYEALEEMVERYAPGYHDCIDNGLPECEICNARAALAKARGES